MKVIGILSDTHGYLHPRVKHYFEDCDEIWHAGDVGSVDVANTLSQFKPLRMVTGNIDGFDLRNEYPASLRFFCEEVDVFMTHIGGYPGKYDVRIKKQLTNNPPRIFVCGHSHILKVIPDNDLNLLHINPGAAGKMGFHQVLTLVKLKIDGNKIVNLQVIELEKNV